MAKVCAFYLYILKRKNMKKLLTFLLLTILPVFVLAQEKQSVVTLKNGTELKGTIKSLVPTDSLTIVISGIETSIKISDVAKIEEMSQRSRKQKKLFPFLNKQLAKESPLKTERKMLNHLLQ